MAAQQSIFLAVGFLGQRSLPIPTVLWFSPATLPSPEAYSMEQLLTTPHYLGVIGADEDYNEVGHRRRVLLIFQAIP